MRLMDQADQIFPQSQYALKGREIITVPGTVFSTALKREHALENLLTDGFLKNFQELNQIQISVDILKRKLNFQINYRLTSGVKYMDHFREINLIFNNSCGNYVHIIAKLSALENLLIDGF